MQLIKTVLADSHRIFLEGIKTVFESQKDFSIDLVHECNNGTHLIEVLQKYPVDLLILDLNLPDKDGFEVLDYIHKEKIDCKVLILSAYDDPKIVKNAFRKGVDGYILKDQPIEELFEAIQMINDDNNYLGEGVKLVGTSFFKGAFGRKKSLPQLSDKFVKKHSLTKRELEILGLISQALSNKEIAKELFISDQTVSVHRKNIMRKLGVSNTAGLIKLAYDYCLV